MQISAGLRSPEGKRCTRWSIFVMERFTRWRSPMVERFTRRGSQVMDEVEVFDGMPKRGEALCIGTHSCVECWSRRFTDTP